jgi:hypothetical protein
VGLRVGLKAMEKRRILPCRESNYLCSLGTDRTENTSQWCGPRREHRFPLLLYPTVAVELLRSCLLTEPSPSNRSTCLNTIPRNKYHRGVTRFELTFNSCISPSCPFAKPYIEFARINMLPLATKYFHATDGFLVF